MNGPLAQALRRKRPLILDGALGSELRRRGLKTDLPLWSAAPLIDAPQAVMDLHLEYIAAGADIITTDTFRTTARTFRRAAAPDLSRELTHVAVGLCHRACAHFPDREVLIAGSMAPLEDCYRPDLVPPQEDLIAEHTVQAERLASSGVDFLILETMNTIREASAALLAASATGKEVVVSFLCRGHGRLYGGEPLEEAVRVLAPLEPAVFSVNCAPPPVISEAITALRSSTPLPLAVYANVGRAGGEGEMEEFVSTVNEEEYAGFAKEWARSGVAIIGGCCGTTPAYIEKLRGLNRQDAKKE